jgi:hypothetical protein
VVAERALLRPFADRAAARAVRAATHGADVMAGNDELLDVGIEDGDDSMFIIGFGVCAFGGFVLGVLVGLWLAGYWSAP